MKKVIFKDDVKIVRVDSTNCLYHVYGIKVCGGLYVLSHTGYSAIRLDGSMPFCIGPTLVQANTSASLRLLKEQNPDAEIYEFESPREFYEWLIQELKLRGEL